MNATTLLDAPTDSLPPAGSIGHIFNVEDGNPSNAPAIGTTASSQLAQVMAEHRISPPRPFHPQNLPTVSLDELSAAEFIPRALDNQDGDAENAPIAEVAVSLSASLLDVSTDSPVGSIGHIFDDADTNAPNLNVAGTTTSPQTTQPTTERRASPTNILPHSLSIVSFGDFAPADFILHSPDNEDGAAEILPIAEVVASLSDSLSDVSIDSPAGSIDHIFGDADTNASNLNVTGTTTSPQTTQPTTERRALPTIILPHRLSIVSFGDFAPADFIVHSPDSEDGAVEANFFSQNGSCVM
jgi:hypothetical protein